MYYADADRSPEMVASPFLLVSFAAMLLLGGLAQPDAPGSPCPPQVEVAPEEAEQARAVVDEFVAAASTATSASVVSTASAERIKSSWFSEAGAASAPLGISGPVPPLGWG